MPPWEKYKSAPGNGPWSKYASTEPGPVDQPPADPNFEVAQKTAPAGAYGMSASNIPIAPDSPGVDVRRALLTNEPTQGFSESLIRSAPAAIGGAIGATAGAGLGSVPLAGLGGAAGESLRQSAVQGYAGMTGRAFTTPGQVIKNVAIEGAAQSVGQGIGLGAGAAATAARPYVNKLGAQVMRVGSGIPEKQGLAAMQNPSMLLDAPSKEVAAEGYKAFERYTGLSGLDDIVRTRGKFPTESQLEDLLFDAATKVSQKRADPQELYLASQAASNLKQMAKLGNPRYATLEKAINEAKATVDDALQQVYPEYANLRSDYFGAKTREAFGNILPQNKNTSPNVLRAVTAATTAAAGTIAGSPAAMAALPLISPAFYGTVLRGAALAGKIPAGTYQLPARSSAGALAEAYMRQRPAQ